MPYFYKAFNVRADLCSGRETQYSPGKKLQSSTCLPFGDLRVIDVEDSLACCLGGGNDRLCTQGGQETCLVQVSAALI